MKKIILGLLATAVVASPIALAAPAAAQHREVTRVHEGRNGRTVVTTRTTRGPQARGPQYRNWRAGQRFDRRYAQDYRVVNYRQYKFAAPRAGQQWVRSGRDAVLIDRRGNVVQVRGGAFR